MALRLASFNVQSGRGRTGGYDADALTTSVAALDADLVALQEIDHFQTRSGARDQLAELVSALSSDGERWTGHFLPTVLGVPGIVRSWRPAASPQVPEGSSAYGIGLVTRLPVRAWHSLRLTSFWGRLPMLVPTPHGRMVPVLVPDEPRAVLGAVVETELGVLAVMGTHLSFLPPRAVLQLRRTLAWSRSLPEPRLLLGDLNLPGGLPAAVSGWRRLAHGPTFPAPAPRTQLDHVLAHGLDPAIEVRAHTVRGEVSDHRAVVVDLSRR
jgi:endonuclease/exonuclease/phosphatase family metal-dependent hydrolase